METRRVLRLTFNIGLFNTPIASFRQLGVRVDEMHGDKIIGDLALLERVVHECSAPDLRAAVQLQCTALACRGRVKKALPYFCEKPSPNTPDQYCEHLAVSKGKGELGSVVRTA